MATCALFGLVPQATRAHNFCAPINIKGAAANMGEQGHFLSRTGCSFCLSIMKVSLQTECKIKGAFKNKILDFKFFI